MALSNVTYNHDRLDYPAGAYCRWPKRTFVAAIMWKSHDGVCLKLVDLFFDTGVTEYRMLVWDKEFNRPRSVVLVKDCFDLIHCVADASDEIKEKWKVHIDAEERRCRIQTKWALRRRDVELAERCNISRKQLTKLREALDVNTFVAVCELISVKRFRSKFRSGLARQIREWLEDAEPKHPRPLSRKQIFYLLTK